MRTKARKSLDTHTHTHTRPRSSSDPSACTTPARRSDITKLRTSTAYPCFDRSRPRDVCRRFGRTPASTELNCYGSFDIRMETTTLHAYIDGRPTNRLRKSCGSAEPYRQEKLRARALHDENERGGPMLPPGCCSRFVWPTRSTSLLARAPISR